MSTDTDTSTETQKPVDDTQKSERKPGTFEDRYGYIWTIELNYGIILDLKDHGVDLDTFNDASEKDKESKARQFADLITASPQKLVEVFYLICEEEIQKRAFDARAFGRSFNSETFVNATTALLEAMILFYQRTGAGKVLVEQLPAILSEADKRIEARTRERLPKLLQALQE